MKAYFNKIIYVTLILKTVWKAGALYNIYTV
jgi:hypothetical protein